MDFKSLHSGFAILKMAYLYTLDPCTTASKQITPAYDVSMIIVFTKLMKFWKTSDFRHTLMYTSIFVNLTLFKHVYVFRNHEVTLEFISFWLWLLLSLLFLLLFIGHTCFIQTLLIAVMMMKPPSPTSNPSLLSLNIKLYFVLPTYVSLAAANCSRAIWNELDRKNNKLANFMDDLWSE